MRDLLRQICTEQDIEIISGKVSIDHVHLLLSYPAHLSLSKIVQKLKGKSAYKIFARFSYLRKTFWGRHFWARGYLAISTGNITDELIKKYIEEQEGHAITHGEIEITE